MTDPSIRWQCVLRIIDVLREAFDGADVNLSPSWPGDEAGIESVYLFDIGGPLDVPLTRGSEEALIYDDKFEMAWRIQVEPNGRTREEVGTRCEEIIATFIDAIAREAQLQKLTGVISARLTNQDGPSVFELRGTGAVALAELTIAVHSRFQ